MPDLMGQLCAALSALDERLTGKCADRSWCRATDWLDLVGTELYLSDGGYSRIIYGPPRGTTSSLRLTSNSRDEVRAVWKEAHQERARVHRAFSALIHG